jgi:hypothetical protein
VKAWALGLLLMPMLSGCAVSWRWEPLRRGPGEFPPKVSREAEDGIYASRRGFLARERGVDYVMEY